MAKTATAVKSRKSGKAGEPVRPITEPPQAAVLPARAPKTQTLVLHYHLFKNAGTSVDEMLKRNFGDRWAQAEFATHGIAPNVAEVERYLQQHPEIDALSSHTALLPPPKLDGRDVFPIIFIRHPIDRLKSAYNFERVQKAETFGARTARVSDFPGYIRTLLERHGLRQARNFQTFRLSMNEPPSAGTELERALRAIQQLPFVGLVEAYDQSLERVGALVKPFMPQFELYAERRNATQPEDLTLDARLAAIEKELGRELYAELCRANADDLQLFEVVRARYPSTDAHATASTGRPSNAQPAAPAAHAPKLLTASAGVPQALALLRAARAALQDNNLPEPATALQIADELNAIRRQLAARRYEAPSQQKDFAWLEMNWTAQSTQFAIDLVPIVQRLMLKRWKRDDVVTLLDFGAGSGAGANLWTQLHSGNMLWSKLAVDAADINPGRELFARLYYPRVNYIVGDAFKLGRKWDIVICSHVIEHTKDPLNFIKRILDLTNEFAVFYAPYNESKPIPGHVSVITESTFSRFDVVESHIVKSLGWRAVVPDDLCLITVVRPRAAAAPP